MCEPPSSLRYSLRTGLGSGQEGSVQTEGVQGSVAQPCLTLCNPMDCSPPGSLFHRIFQARILDWVAISYSSGHLPDQGVEPMSPALAGGFFTTEPWRHLL